MESAISVTFSTFDPELAKPINVTDLLENRHITCAVQSIMTGLEDYCSGFFRLDLPATIYRSTHHLWISIGEVPLSKKLKEALRNKFQVNNDKLIFYDWEQMVANYPDVSNTKKSHGNTPAFVGFPLPEKDTSEN